MSTYDTSRSPRLRALFSTVTHHVKTHVGVGIVCSVAYFDPGNWSVDMQAGAIFGYRPMLFVLLAAGLSAMILQTLACRLGCVTGLDLASHCRLLLHDRPRYPRLLRWLTLYPLYILAEIAIISTDLAELLGSAIGFCLLFPQLPLWAGVVLTAGDVFIFLLISDPTRRKGGPARVFEIIIILLVFAVFICFLILLVQVRPNWPRVFIGFLPSKTLFQSEPDAVYTAVGILGATVMPHALFLGSFMATLDRESSSDSESLPTPGPRPQPLSQTQFENVVSQLFRLERTHSAYNSPKTHRDHENNGLLFIRNHLPNLTVDVVASLLLLAVPINSAILIVAATVFFGHQDGAPSGLFEAHDLIVARVGRAAGILFALALVCAGQTAGVTATLAGQIVSEGFIQWRVPPFLRRIITRSLSLVPSVVVAVAVGPEGLNALLVASQVVLSVVLPFIAFPLIYLTSSRHIMQVKNEPRQQSVPESSPPPLSGTSTTLSDTARRSSIDISPTTETERAPTNLTEISVVSVQLERDNSLPIPSLKPETDSRLVPPADTFINFSNGRIITGLSYIIGIIVLTANAYAITMLILGRVKPQTSGMTT